MNNVNNIRMEVLVTILISSCIIACCSIINLGVSVNNSDKLTTIQTEQTEIDSLKQELNRLKGLQESKSDSSN